MTEQEINNLIDSKIGKTKMSQLPEATQTSGLYSIGYTGNQSVKYKANLLQGDPLTVRKTYQTEALALADKNPIDIATSLPLAVGQFVSIVDDGEKNGIYRIASISGDGTMSLELQGKLGDLSDYAKKIDIGDKITITANGKVKKDGEDIDINITDNQVSSLILRNAVRNGDFSNGSNDWTLLQGSTVGAGTATLQSSSTYSAITQTPLWDSGTRDSNLLYVKYEVKFNNATSGDLKMGGIAGTDVILKIISQEVGTHSYIFNNKDGGNRLSFFWDKGDSDIGITNIVIVDLSNDLGTNLPSKEKIDRLIDLLPSKYFDNYISSRFINRWLFGETNVIDYNSKVFGGVSLIGDSSIGMSIPNVNTFDKTLDLGEDPIILIGANSYPLKVIHSNNTSKYREINLDTSHIEGSSAFKLYFDIDSKEFMWLDYTTDVPNSYALIGSLRVRARDFSNVHALSKLDLPFDYTINGYYPQESARVIPDRNKLPDFDTGNRKIDMGEDIVVVLGNNNFVPIDSSYDTNHRDIDIAAFTSIILVLDLYDMQFKTFGFGVKLIRGQVVIGTYRIVGNKVTSDVSSDFLVNGSSEQVGTDIELSSVNIDSSVKLIAHRGTWWGGIAPENSIDAVRFASRLGYDATETDFSPTKDGVLVLMHDYTINRMMRNKNDYSEIDGEVRHRQTNYQELVDNFVLASDNPSMRREIPTLEDYFIACRDNNIFPIPEIKDNSITNEHIDNAYNMGCEIMGKDNFAFISFNYEFLDYVRTLSDEIDLYFTSQDSSETILGTVSSVDSTTREHPNNIWYPRYSEIDEDTVRQYHKKGMKVAVWTINPNLFEKYVRMGVDEIATDFSGANLGNKAGFLISSLNGWDAFNSSGAFNSNGVAINTGQNISFATPPNSGISCYTLNIIYKGSVKITSKNLSIVVSSDNFTMSRHQVLINGENDNVNIVSQSNGTLIQSIDYKLVKF